MGHTSVTVSPAVIYTIVFAAYSSLFAPFLGFFASGFKRAVGIKDFGNTLPGHGGILDRFDCITNIGVFTYIMLTQVMLRDQLDAQAAYQ